MTVRQLSKIFVLGSKWTRTNHRFPQKTGGQVVAKAGEAVPVEVIAVNKDGVVFRTPHGDAWLSPPDAPGMAVSVQPDRVEITDQRGPWLTYARQVSEAVVSVLLDGEMSPENFVKDFSSEWSYKLSRNPDSSARLHMRVIATFYLGFDRVGNRYVSDDEAAEWYLKLIKWLDTRLPFEKFRHFKYPLPLRKDTDQFPFDDWILSAKAKGLIDRFKTIFGESP